MPRTVTTSHELLDAVKGFLDIQEDGLLAKALKVQPSCICKIRSGTNNVSDTILLKIHLLTRVPVEELLQYCPKDDTP